MQTANTDANIGANVNDNADTDATANTGAKSPSLSSSWSRVSRTFLLCQTGVELVRLVELV